MLIQKHIPVTSMHRKKKKCTKVITVFCPFIYSGFLIHEADHSPAGSDHYFHAECLSVRTRPSVLPKTSKSGDNHCRPRLWAGRVDHWWLLSCSCLWPGFPVWCNAHFNVLQAEPNFRYFSTKSWHVCLFKFKYILITFHFLIKFNWMLALQTCLSRQQTYLWTKNTLGVGR